MDESKARERVLVFPESRFRAAGIFHGLRPYSAEFLATILDPQYLTYRPRGEVETDPSFKQLIPYIVLRCRGELFHYRRGAAGTEKRLQSLRSIGIGGHISQEDGASASDSYRIGMMRELHEEVEITVRLGNSVSASFSTERVPWAKCTWELFMFSISNSRARGRVKLSLLNRVSLRFGNSSRIAMSSRHGRSLRWKRLCDFLLDDPSLPTLQFIVRCHQTARRAET